MVFLIPFVIVMAPEDEEEVHECPLFNDTQAYFCVRCDIEVPEGFLDDVSFDILSSRCARNIDIALEDLELSPPPPQQMDEKAAQVVFKLDKIINNRFKLSKVTRHTLDIVMNRFGNIDKKLGKRRVKLAVEIGNLYFGLKEYKKAISWYELATKIDPENKDSWNNTGVAMVRLGKVDGALRFYDLAIKINPGYEQAWFNKGKALYKLRRMKEALSCFKKVIEINPDSASAWNNIGVIQRILGKPREALKAYDEAIKTKDDYEWAWHNKGMILAESKDYDEAMKCFDKALEIDRDFKPAKDAKEMYDKYAGKGKLFKFGLRKKK